MKKKFLVIFFTVLSLCILTDCINVEADNNDTHTQCVSQCAKNGVPTKECIDACEKDAKVKNDCDEQCKNSGEQNEECMTKCVNYKKGNTKDILGCQSLLGDPDDPKEESIAWLLQQILNYAKYGGIFLILILSSVDFAKAIVANDDENMKKVQKRLIYRLIAAAFLFFVPTLVMVILNVFGIVGDTTCEIE